MPEVDHPQPFLGGINYHSSRYTMLTSRGNFHYSGSFSLSCVFIMPEVNVTTTSTTPPVIVVCSRALSITTTITMAPTTLHLAVSGQYDVVLLPQLILRDTVKGSVSLTIVPQQQQPSLRCFLGLMPLMPLVLLRWVFSFRVEPP